MIAREQRNGSVAPGLVFGLAIVVVGVVLLLDRLGILEAQEVFRYWPMILVAIGVAHLVESHAPPRKVWGSLLVIVGVILQMSNLGVWRVHLRDLWPLALIAVGLLFVWRALNRPLWEGKFRGKFETFDSALNEWAVFGGGKRIITAQNFKGGEALAVFGGFEIDLRRAEIEGESAAVHVNAVFGGIELRVPEHWDVISHGIPVFGGFEDKTVHPKPGGTPPPKRLILDGVVVFGGLEVKN